SLDREHNPAALDQKPTQPNRFLSLTRLFEPAQRGLLLDLVVFILNLFAMSWLSHAFYETLGSIDGDGPASVTVVLVVCGLMFTLAPIGATLKRWHMHDRRASERNLFDADGLAGCLFNPIFYFCLTALIFAALNAFVMQEVYGRHEPPGGIFVGSILGGILLMIVHTILVYRYFSPPASPPRSAFLRSPAAGFLGDVCLFLNMALFQLWWNLLARVEAPPPSGAFDLIARFCILAFLALLIYFPPRMFYLAEDIGRGRTWLMILVANSPILYRVLVGGTGW
ncbi:MAG TPA: hypothetical protein PLX06_03470, partial [Fimbriimonadaceae bacterium]|nr:hypothetical protein [Fimbriimonadaceae bacterium]